MQAANWLVDTIDRLALAMHRKVTKPLAAEALARAGQKDDNE